jgi:hypothetical protein
MQDRTEWYTARQMHHLSLINGGKANLSDFMCFYHEDSEEDATPEDLLNLLQISAKTNR